MRPSTVLVGILAVTPLATVIAQQDEQREPATRFVGGGRATVALPVGAFRKFVDAGFGINGFLVWNVERQGILGVRLDGYGLIYGSETVRRPLSQTIRRIEVDVTTENTIAGLAIGPQLSVGLDRLRPYVNSQKVVGRLSTRLLERQALSHGLSPRSPDRWPKRRQPASSVSHNQATSAPRYNDSAAGAFRAHAGDARKALACGEWATPQKGAPCEWCTPGQECVMCS